MCLCVCVVVCLCECKTCVRVTTNASVKNYLPPSPRGSSHPKNAPRWALAGNFDKNRTKFVE